MMADKKDFYALSNIIHLIGFLINGKILNYIVNVFDTKIDHYIPLDLLSTIFGCVLHNRIFCINSRLRDNWTVIF